MDKSKISIWYLVFSIAAYIFIIPSAAWTEEIRVLVCPEGCGPLVTDIYLSQEIKKRNPKFNFIPEATNGYLYNLNEMGRNSNLWKNTIFACNDDTLSFAPRGGKHPFKKFIPEPVSENFKLLYGFYWGATGHYFITLNPEIKKVNDLKGKKLGVGLAGQSDWGMNPTLDLEYGYGITEKNTEIFYLGPSRVGDALLSGEVDAIVAALGTGVAHKDWLPAAIFRQLKRSRKKLYYIGHEHGFSHKMNEILGTSYIDVNIPAGTLPRQTEIIHAIADRDFKACHETFPDDLAYKLVKLIVKIAPSMKLSMGLWQTWSPEIMVAGLSEENAHPGAVRAYKELGWWDLRHKFKAIVLPKVNKPLR